MPSALHIRTTNTHCHHVRDLTAADAQQMMSPAEQERVAAAKKIAGHFSVIVSNPVGLFC